MKAETTLHELIRRIERLEREVFGATGRKTKEKRGTTVASSGSRLERIDFSMSMRAFVKKHTPGMNGAKKFALLLAYLTKGEASKKVPFNELRRQWNRMTGK